MAREREDTPHAVPVPEILREQVSVPWGDVAGIGSTVLCVGLAIVLSQPSIALVAVFAHAGHLRWRALQHSRTASELTRWRRTAQAEQSQVLRLTDRLAVKQREASRTRERALIAEAVGEEAHDYLLAGSHGQSVGSLVADIMHEINNPLTVVSGKAQYLALLDDERLIEKRDHLAHIINAAQRISLLVAPLQRYAHAGTKTDGRAPVKAAIDEALVLKQCGLKRQGIKLTLDIKADLPNVMLSPVELEQVLIHLLDNAIEAMESSKKKHLTVTASATPKDHVLVTITDTGTGIPRNIRGHIFEALFSTKQPIQGRVRGLGLSSTIEILARHGGSINLRSRSGKGKGTEARLYLPQSPTNRRD